VKTRIESVVQKIQQLGQANRPISFQSPEKYPDVQRPEKIQHSFVNRHASVYTPVLENKEWVHLPEQLSAMITTTESELKEMLDITRHCFDSKTFSALTANVSYSNKA
jgi:hypothetical protein